MHLFDGQFLHDLSDENAFGWLFTGLSWMAFEFSVTKIHFPPQKISSQPVHRIDSCFYITYSSFKTKPFGIYSRFFVAHNFINRNMFVRMKFCNKKYLKLYREKGSNTFLFSPSQSKNITYNSNSIPFPIGKKSIYKNGGIRMWITSHGVPISLHNITTLGEHILLCINTHFVSGLFFYTFFVI